MVGSGTGPVSVWPGLVVHSHRVQDDHLLVHVGVLGTARVDGDHSVCAVSGIQARGIALCHDFFPGFLNVIFFGLRMGISKLHRNTRAHTETMTVGFPKKRKLRSWRMWPSPSLKYEIRRGVPLGRYALLRRHLVQKSKRVVQNQPYPPPWYSHQWSWPRWATWILVLVSTYQRRIESSRYSTGGPRQRQQALIVGSLVDTRLARM